jgi:hypothetical protein
VKKKEGEASQDQPIKGNQPMTWREHTQRSTNQRKPTYDLEGAYSKRVEFPLIEGIELKIINM